MTRAEWIDKTCQNADEERRIVDNVKLRIRSSHETFITLSVADLKAMLSEAAK